MKKKPKFNSIDLFWESTGGGKVEKEREKEKADRSRNDLTL